MLEEHSLGLVTSTVVSVIVYIIGLVINLSDFARQYLSVPLSMIPSILRNNGTNYMLPVSLADWSVSVWGVVYVCQSFWLVYAVSGICRKTAAGPAYNNPKLLPVQVHIFFSLAVLLQVGWLVSMDKLNLGFALLLILVATGCSVATLCESYRALASTQALLVQLERSCDLWSVRILAQNGLAVLMVWITLHATLTFALFLTFGMKSHYVAATTSSIVEVCCAGFLIIVYVITDLTVLDKYSRLVVSPYLAFVLFHAAQLNKDWEDTHTPLFALLAFFTAFSFLALFLKVVLLLWRQLSRGQPETPITMSHPLPTEMEEEAYLLERK